MLRSFLFASLVACGTSLLTCTISSAEKPYEASWESLSKHLEPEWLSDAKFGIYTHWGPVTVGSQDAERGRVQWYGMGMYQPKDEAFEFHRRTFGDQQQFGYKDVVRLFKAEKFDADRWAQLFAASGAKFAGPVAIHHDNFAMWDSAVTKWDSKDQGPRRDITAELEKAIRAHGMKFIATFHHAFSWRYFEPSYKFDGANPQYADLYCEVHQADAPPTGRFLDQWLDKVNEVVQKYQPDLIWFDFGLGARNCITPEYQQRMFADALYVIVLGPREGDVTLSSVQVDQIAPAASVRWLGFDGPVEYAVNESQQLVIRLPKLRAEKLPSQHAMAFKVTGFTTGLHPDASSSDRGTSE